MENKPFKPLIITIIIIAIIVVYEVIYPKEITEFLKTYWLNITVIGIILLTLIGTVTNSKGGLIPFHTKKIGKSFGICFNIYNLFTESTKHTGITTGLINVYEENSIINGVSFPIIFTWFQDNSKKRNKFVFMEYF